jgi:hypothetical protein
MNIKFLLFLATIAVASCEIDFAMFDWRDPHPNISTVRHQDIATSTEFLKWLEFCLTSTQATHGAAEV